MEIKKFKVHPDIIFKLIDSQAGSAEKALLELVMNSVDAGATEVKVEISSKSFRVSDNGRGFEDLRSVDEFFGTFGTPHKEGDATYGKFRLGRGQIMAFATNNWRSGEFFMGVDVKNRGTEYDQKTGLPFHEGCEIKGDFYDPLSRSETLVTERNLAEMVQYVTVPVFINGKQCAQKQVGMKWTFEDEDAYYQLSESKGYLAVYNLGVFVSNVSAGSYGIGGVVVTKRQLTLNMARNDVLKVKCDVWQRMTKVMRKHATNAQKKAPVKNESYRELMARKLVSGDYDSLDDFGADMSGERLFTDVCGKNHSLMDIAKTVQSSGIKVCFSDNPSDMVADKVHQQRLAFVLSSKTSERFKCDGDFHGLMLKIKESYDRAVIDGDGKFRVWGDLYARAINALVDAATTLKKVRGKINDDMLSCSDSELTGSEMAVLRVIRKASDSVFRGICNRWSLGSGRPIRREIMAGVSDVANGWTNGVNVIWVNRKTLTVRGAKGATMSHFTKLALLVAHEYCHCDDDAESNVHGPEFYESYHELVMRTDCVSDFVGSALCEWSKHLLSSKKRLRTSDLEAIDLVESSIEDESERVAA